MKQLIIILFISSPLYFYVNKGTEAYTTGIVYNMYRSPYKMMEEGQSLLKEGDLVVRLNRDPSSLFIKYFNRRDKKYSHSGIVLFENGRPYVFHIVNGEENPGEKMRMDSLSRFCNPGKNRAYGIFRYNMNDVEIKRLKEYIHKVYADGIRFDHRFDLTSDDRMYCSELVSKALAEATDKRISVEPIQLTHVEATFISAYAHLPYSYASHLGIVPIDALYTNPFCRLIKEYNY
jgi:hypothetical protein